MIRRTTIINPGRLPVSQITDRAKRYRAQHPDVVPPPPKRCNYCGGRRNVGVEHISGDEADGSPENLMWSCKRCNAIVAAVVKRAGLGRRVNQYNPRRNAGKQTRASQMRDYGNAIKVMRGDFEGDVSAAVATIRATPRAIRSAYTSRAWPVRRQMYGQSGRRQGKLFDEVPF
jgi:hypothetical protein